MQIPHCVQLTVKNKESSNTRVCLTLVDSNVGTLTAIHKSKINGA